MRCLLLLLSLFTFIESSIVDNGNNENQSRESGFCLEMWEWEQESRGIYVFDVSEFEILSEWEYTCTARIYFMGISSGAQIWHFDWLGGVMDSSCFLKYAPFFMRFYLFIYFWSFSLSGSPARRALLLTLRTHHFMAQKWYNYNFCHHFSPTLFPWQVIRIK